MDQEPKNAYERYKEERAAERASRENRKTARRDDVDRCRAVYSLSGRNDDDGDPEFY